jgi:hypothetical protein
MGSGFGSVFMMGGVRMGSGFGAGFVMDGVRGFMMDGVRVHDGWDQGS